VIERLNCFTTCCFGEDHTVLLDSKSRIWACGEFKNGALGFEPERPDKQVMGGIVYEPHLVTEGLPKINSKKKKIIEIKTGYTHSMAVGKNGELYSWGDGSF
jgi:alpha-tubulin suppressor-like RCC1 family protein